MRKHTPPCHSLSLAHTCTSIRTSDALKAGRGQILDVYRSMILSAERAILDDPTLPLTYLVSRTTDFVLLLPALLRLADEVQANKVHGCKLLDLVSQHACSGVPVVRSCTQRILARCFMVLYAQVSAWAVYGMLSDPHAEFCVRPVPRKHAADHAEEFHPAGYAEDQNYMLHADMKPRVLSAAVAEKLLLCGVAMRVIMHPKAHADDRPEPEVMAKFNEQIKHLASAPEFHRASFEGLVDEIHTYLSRRLWSLVVERARLLKHLRAVKDYYLLARGDLFQAFIDNTRGLLALPPSDTVEHDVNEPFRRAALLSYADEDELFASTRLAVEHSDAATDAHQGQGAEEEEGLDKLRMHMDMEWPLGTLLLTPEVMRKYNELFVFLLRVKRAKTELQQAWLQTQSGRYGRAISSTLSKGSESTQHMVSMWALRAEMAFLVNNLLYYLQCDVLDSQFQALKDAVDASDSFEDIRVAHTKFLEHILLDCLTYNKLTWTTVPEHTHTHTHTHTHCT
jgi:gamma-tubulin complex component 4